MPGIITSSGLYSSFSSFGTLVTGDADHSMSNVPPSKSLTSSLRIPCNFGHSFLERAVQAAWWSVEP